MFCPRCGMKAVDGGVFCQKCGARLVVDEAGQSVVAVTSSSQEYTKMYNDPVDVPKKLKTGKILIILGIVVLVIVAIVATSGMWEDLSGLLSGTEPQEMDAIKNTDSSSLVNEENPDVSQIFFKDIPLDTLFSLRAVDVMEELGSSFTDSDDNIRLYTSEIGVVTGIEIINVGVLTMNGTGLDTDRDGLVALLGEPSEEGNDSGYFMKYQFSGYSMYFELGEADSTVWRVQISPYNEDVSDNLSRKEAQDIVDNWVAEHRLGDCQTQDAEYIIDTDDGMYKYNIICDGGVSEYFIYVNPENGLMSIEDHGNYYDSIEYWYRTVWLEEELEIQYDQDGNEVYYAHISYGNLSRYTDDYIGETVVVKPFSISQILQLNDGTYIAGYESSYNDYFDSWLPDYDKQYIIDVTDIDTKLLSGDVVDIYGIFSGLKTMTSAIGSVDNDYPLITADIVLFEDAVD